MRNTKKATKSKEKKIVFDNAEYTISEIPLNYQIDCKIKYDLKGKQRKLISLPFYSCLESGLNGAHELALYMIGKYKTEYRAVRGDKGLLKNDQIAHGGSV